MRFQQVKLTNDYGIAEEEDSHVGMAEARREDKKVKYSSHEKVRMRGGI